MPETTEKNLTKVIKRHSGTKVELLVAFIYKITINLFPNYFCPRHLEGEEKKVAGLGFDAVFGDGQMYDKKKGGSGGSTF